MHDWVNTIIKSDDSMKTAIKVISAESLGIAMVINENGKLLGTITDGDIRRALIRNCKMDENVSNIMHKDPIIASDKDDREALLLMMQEKSILQVPILDTDGRIVGLETLHHLLENKKYDNPVFLMAGGFGKRLRPLTNDIPKPLLTVGSKPIMETILNQFREFGFHNFYISTHYKAEKVNEYFGNGSKWGVKIHYIHENTPLGTAGALGLLPKDLSDLPIIVMNADLLTKVDFTQLLNYHVKNDGIATVCTRAYDFQVPYGVVQTEDHRITSIVEKPIHKFFVNAGVYVFNTSLVKNIDGCSYLDMPTLLDEQIKLNQQINSFPIHEYWLDIGQLDEYKRANLEYFSNIEY